MKKNGILIFTWTLLFCHLVVAATTVTLSDAEFWSSTDSMETCKEVYKHTLTEDKKDQLHTLCIDRVAGSASVVKMNFTDIDLKEVEECNLYLINVLIESPVKIMDACVKRANSSPNFFSDSFRQCVLGGYSKYIEFSRSTQRALMYHRAAMDCFQEEHDDKSPSDWFKEVMD